MLRAAYFGAAFCAIDLVFYFGFVGLYAYIAKDFYFSDSLVFSFRFLIWRLFYLQIPIQLVFVSVSYHFGLSHNGLIVVFAAVIAFVISIYVVSGEIVGALRSLIPYFSVEYFNEGFLLIVTSFLSWIAMKSIAPLIGAEQ